MGLRDFLAAISPPWLRHGTGVLDPDQRVGPSLVYVFGLLLDLVVDKANQAILAWMPTKSETETSLVFIGDDRRIPQGPNESTDAYRIRLQRAFDSWRFAGMARGKLGQILGFVSPATPRILQVSQASDWYYYAAADDPSSAPTFYRPSPANWDWDSVSDPHHVTRWWRVWLILDATGWTVAGGVTTTFGAGSPYGLSVSAGFLEELRQIVALWKRAGCVVLWIMVRTTGGNPTFDPGAALGSGALPDGNWGRWSKIVAGKRVRARATGVFYINGVI